MLLSLPLRRAVAAAGLALGLAGCGATSTSTGAPPPARTGLAFGVQLDWATDSPAALVARSGLHPAQYGAFAAFPLTEQARRQLTDQAAAARATSASLFLTLEPTGGLATVTPAAADDLAGALAAVNAGGVPVLVRFGHEMNGPWYAWGQRPAAYRAAFRTVAEAVHRRAPGSATVWSPNYGGGYPFAASGPAPSPADAAELDTDGDGRLTAADDPYAPYWPGDDAVDRVGLTVYHWGAVYPWREDEVPEPGKLLAQVTGTYDGAGGDQRVVPDFAATWADGHRKPMVLSETGALWTAQPSVPGADERSVKRAWLEQVLDPHLATALPRLDMVNWFEERKPEAETGAMVDWRVTADPGLAADVRRLLAVPRPAPPG